MNKKKLSGWLAGFAAIAAAIVAAKQPHKAPVPAEWPTAAILGEWRGTCHAVVTEQAHREITEPELADCLARAKAGSQAADLRTWADGLPKPEAPPVVVAPEIHLSPLSTHGPIFVQDGQPWRYKGVTAFGLLNRYAHGEDIQPFLDDFKGFNVLRIFLYAEWGADGWDSPPAETVVRFLQVCERSGFYVELVLLTDDKAVRVEQAKALLAALTLDPRPSNLLIEAGNEPQTNKAINTGALRSSLGASGFLHSSGDYEDSRRFYGSYLTTHTSRDGEWPRRAHDLLEFYQGGGPNDPSDPAHKVPVVADEPIRPDQSGFNDADFRAYFGAVALLGAGGTYHFESGKYGRRPTVDEQRIASVVLGALNAFPADAPTGPYVRPVEQSLRTYQVGPWMVRVRPQTPTFADPAWVPIDDAGILWKKR